MTGPALLVRGLAYSYPDGQVALCGVDLLVEHGERVALLGPNGAGKTTFMLQLNGTLRPAGGSVSVNGIPVGGDDLPAVRQQVGLLFQDPDDQLVMPTVWQDVAFGPANLGLRGTELDRRVESALAQVGLAGHGERAPHHLSFGERRRVALAGVLAMRPTLLVLDEPTSNLDPAARRELAEILLGLDVTLLMATHDLPYALQLCDRSVVLSGGRVVADTSTSRLLMQDELLAAHRLELPYGFRLA